MTEATMTAFGSMIGAMIALAVVTFALRGKRHEGAETRGLE